MQSERAEKRAMCASLRRRRARDMRAGEWNFQIGKTKTKKQFEELTQKAREIDESLIDHVEALSAKQQKAIQQLSEKMIRAERRQQTEAASRIQYLKSSLFPNRGLQERSSNFSEIYLSEGKGIIQLLINTQ